MIFFFVFKNLYFLSIVIDFNKLGLNVRNARGLHIFSNKTCLSYHYHQKMVDAGAITAAGSSNGVTYV